MSVSVSVILIYKTDNWHSYPSRDVIGAATDKRKAINICQLQAKKEGEVITTDQIYNLGTIMQTQGYSGEGEFVWEEIETDTLL